MSPSIDTMRGAHATHVRQKEITMRCLNLAVKYMLTSIAHFSPADDGEPIGIIELDENLGDAEKPEEIPPGLYTAEVQDVQTPVSGKGNTYFAIKFVISPDDLPADIREDYPDGAVLFWNRVIVPKKGDRRALFALRKFVESIGIDSNTTSIDPNEWMGRQARVRVAHDRYQGETRAQIKSVEAAEEVPKRPVTPRGRAPVEEVAETKPRRRAAK